jgi:uncharacterized protein YqeY
MTMELLERIQADVKDAMRARDSDRVQSLRMFVAALQNEAKSRLRDLEDGEQLAVLTRERKKRVESAEQFEQAGHADKAHAEREQMALIDAYLPAQLDDAELAKLVAEAVAETGATSPKDMGTVMKALMPKVQGRADGKVVSAAVNAALR